MQALQQSFQKLTNLKNNKVISSEEYESLRQQLVDRYLQVPTLCTVPQSSTSHSQLLNNIAWCGFGAPCTAADVHSPGLPWGDSVRGFAEQELCHDAGSFPSKRGTVYRSTSRNCTIEVEPLSPDVTREVLVATFSVFGEVASAAIRRGYPIRGYVTFETPDAAAQAQARGQLRLGTTIVFIAFVGQRRSSKPEASPSNGLGLFNLPFSTTLEELRCMLADYDGLQSIKMVHRKDTGHFKGYAFAYFDTVAHATEAKARLAGLTMGEQRVDVKFAAQHAGTAPMTAAQSPL
eukprot:EG_transcript_11930